MKKSKNKIKFIVVEGLDGSGKSTISKSLAAKTESIYLTTPSKADKRERELYDSKGFSCLDRFLFYAGCTVKTSDQIKELIKCKKRVVLDRYFYSTLAYHLPFCKDINEDHINIFNTIIRPDLIIYVTADYEITVNRIKQRSLIENNDKLYLAQSPENHSLIHSQYLKSFDVPYLHVCNNGTLDDSLSKIERLLC